MYNANQSIDTAYNYIQALRSKGYSYKGTPVYDVSKSDLLELKKIGDKYNIPFEWLINLIRYESGATFSPAITNSIGATGLIQFLKSTAQNLGTTTSDLKKMTFKQQLVYVDKYLYENLKRHLTSEGKIPNTFTQGDIFMTIFYPVAVGKPNYKFSDKVSNANAGIRTPMDYVNKALENSVFPLSAFPYTLSDVKKKLGEGYDKVESQVTSTVNKIKTNPLPTVLIFVGIGGLIYSMFNIKNIF